MSRTAARRAGLGVMVSVLLVASGCGTTEPEPLEAMDPVAPADLCALVPEATKAGLVTTASVDETGNPTAACSLRSAPGAATQVSGVVTWVKLNDEESADRAFDSQCQAMDPGEYRKQTGFQAEGADEACAGDAAAADAATVAAVQDVEVLTVRLTSAPAGRPAALARSQAMLEGVLSEMGSS